MPRWILFLVFFLVASLVVGGVHYYLYRRLVVAPALPAPWSTMARVALITLVSAIPLSFLLIRLVDTSVSRVLVYPVYIWLGLMMMLFFLLLGFEVLQGLGWIGARLAGRPELLGDPDRRRFFARAIAGTAAGTTLAAASYATWQGLRELVVKPVEVSLPGLPAAFDQFTIVQITDLHIGPMRGNGWMAEVVARVNALSPDVVAITGDLVDGTVAQLAHDVAPLRELRARHGVFFVTGNHEYFADLEGWLAHLPTLGVRVLRNERVALRRGDAVLQLAGVDDHEGKRFASGHGADVAKALRGRAPGQPLVLLAHQPKAIQEAAKHGASLVLSGHTHGGQIWPWRYLVYLQQPYVSGLHRLRDTAIYVSSGTGFWGPPMRLGSTAEITKVTLRARGRKRA